MGCRWQVLRGDVRKFCARYDGPPFMAMLTDPPYHLSGGFMQKKWDQGNIAFRPETWAALAKHLLPGAFGMSFAGSRGWHRVACAIEDAGLRLHPTIFCWAFGSGFPKATRLDTQIDRAAGKEQKVVGPSQYATRRGRRPRAMNPGGGKRNVKDTRELMEPATDLAHTWAGHRYGLQALKPAVEPIIVFQKPYEGKPIDSIVKHGAGALNIEAARIRLAANEDVEKLNARSGGHRGFASQYVGGSDHPLPPGCDLSKGRWPANFVLNCACSAIDWCDCDD